MGLERQINSLNVFSFKGGKVVCLGYTVQGNSLCLLLQGYLWSLQVKLEPVVNLLLDKGKLMDFLLQRKECKMVILSVCSQSKFKCLFCILKVQYCLFVNTQVSLAVLRFEITSEGALVLKMSFASTTLSHYSERI